MSTQTMVVAVALCGGGPGFAIGGGYCFLMARELSSAYGAPLREFRDLLTMAAICIPLGLVLGALAFIVLPHMP